MPTDDSRDIARLIADAQAGDATAFSELYTRYAGLILRYLYARTREQEAAQDFTQEVFMRVLRGIGGFEYRGERSWLGWLYTIAGNVLIGHARRRQPLSTPLDPDNQIVDPNSQTMVHSLHDRLELQHALSQLTSDQQQVLTLKFFADLNNAEIARTLGRTEGAVKALQHRALASLQTILRETRHEPTDQAFGDEAEQLTGRQVGSSGPTVE